jgi:hypothetical protein
MPEYVVNDISTHKEKVFRTSPMNSISNAKETPIKQEVTPSSPPASSLKSKRTTLEVYNRIYGTSPPSRLLRVKEDG